ncbi:hypothetical protein AX774_g5423 [Zancudomyces culisetae]|uniref:FANCI solenoid 4 domain-containing protein n=1 Tax=Zancudomyces culisetae TaxID=1213189 RepID=A0A1R1PJH1_ZANCU|nr:hypothetical protein AX774_g5423 [Zancudomyces culisetae]|eukprot:OMH81125.1 hypothetical protein AX774_g5423 [Zancudomyces culisetae]
MSAITTDNILELIFSNNYIIPNFVDIDTLKRSSVLVYTLLLDASNTLNQRLSQDQNSQSGLDGTSQHSQLNNTNFLMQASINPEISNNSAVPTNTLGYTDPSIVDNLFSLFSQLMYILPDCNLGSKFKNKTTHSMLLSKLQVPSLCFYLPFWGFEDPKASTFRVNLGYGDRLNNEISDDLSFSSSYSDKQKTLEVFWDLQDKCLNIYGLICEDLSNVYDKLVDSASNQDENIDFDPKFALVNSKSSVSIINNILSIINLHFDLVSFFTISFPYNQYLHLRICKRLLHIIHLLDTLLSLSLPSTLTLSIYKSLTLLYNTLNCLFDFTHETSSTFIQLISFVGSNISSSLYKSLAFSLQFDSSATTEQPKHSKKASLKSEKGQDNDIHKDDSNLNIPNSSVIRNIKKESKVIPQLIYSQEKSEHQVILLGKRLHVNLLQYFKRNVARDFKLSAPQFTYQPNPPRQSPTPTTLLSTSTNNGKRKRRIQSSSSQHSSSHSPVASPTKKPVIDNSYASSDDCEEKTCEENEPDEMEDDNGELSDDPSVDLMLDLDDDE